MIKKKQKQKHNANCWHGAMNSDVRKISVYEKDQCSRISNDGTGLSRF
jgi:hypothetical protein